MKWKHFLDAISQKNTQAIQLLSLETIECYKCMDNTEQEASEIKQLRIAGDFNSITRRKHVPVERFLKEDFTLIFTNDFIERLLNNKTVFSSREHNEEIIHEAIVDIYPSKGPETKNPGQAYVFDFKDTKDGLKFSGLHTVP